MALGSSIALLAIAGCERKQATQGPPGGGQRPPARVMTMAALAKDVQVYISEIGRTVPVETVNIIPQVGGKVVAAHVENGAFVKKGELLFEIDPRPFEAALASAEAAVRQSKAEAELSESELRRTEDASKANAVSKMELDQKRSATAVASAKIGGAQASLEMAKLNLEYTKIRSPIDGRAGVRMVDQGNVVKANEGVMLSVQRLDPIFAEFTITENDLGTVRKHLAAAGVQLGEHPEQGLKVEVDIPGDSARVLQALGRPPAGDPATRASAPTTNPTHAGPRQGTLTFLDNSVQNGTGTVRLRATVANGDHYFWPGQFVNVRLVLTTRKDAVLIPPQAQQIGQQGPFVYVVSAEGVAEIRPITPGQAQGDFIVVERGLSAGERVIVSGQMAVVPGSKVEVLPDTPPAGAPTAQAGH